MELIFKHVSSGRKGLWLFGTTASLSTLLCLTGRLVKEGTWLESLRKLSSLSRHHSRRDIYIIESLELYPPLPLQAEIFWPLVYVALDCVCDLLVDV